MRTSKLARVALALAVGAALSAIVDCGSSTTCLRYSDCDQGLTCANGLCVVPPVETDGGDDGGAVSSVEDGSTTSDSSVALIDAAMVVTGNDASGAASDASNAGDAADSALSSDASTD